VLTITEIISIFLRSTINTSRKCYRFFDSGQNNKDIAQIDKLIMNNKDEPFLKHRLKSFGYAIKGMLLLIRTESSIQIQFSLALLVTAAGFYFEISATEWILQVLTIALVMSIEGLNTALEKLCDFIHEDFEPKIGFIKDISAGAVFFTAIAALIVALIIYVPKISSMYAPL